MVELVEELGAGGSAVFVISDFYLLVHLLALSLQLLECQLRGLFVFNRALGENFDRFSFRILVVALQVEERAG